MDGVAGQGVDFIFISPYYNLKALESQQHLFMTVNAAF